MLNRGECVTQIGVISALSFCVSVSSWFVLNVLSPRSVRRRRNPAALLVLSHLSQSEKNCVMLSRWSRHEPRILHWVELFRGEGRGGGLCSRQRTPRERERVRGGVTVRSTARYLCPREPRLISADPLRGAQIQPRLRSQKFVPQL